MSAQASGSIAIDRHPIWVSSREILAKFSTEIERVAISVKLFGIIVANTDPHIPPLSGLVPSLPSRSLFLGSGSFFDPQCVAPPPPRCTADQKRNLEPSAR